MPRETRYLNVWIDRPVTAVYDYASDPRHVPEWAPGLGRSIEYDDGGWFIPTDEGRVGLAFAEPNPFGVLDHDVTLPTGEVITVRMRAVAEGDGTEVVFTLRRQPGVTDDEFDRDEGLVQADLNRLKAILEAS
jgi:hypothetical protein